VISLTDFFAAASRHHNDVILLLTLFQQDSAPAHRAAHVQQLNCCIKKRQTFLRPTLTNSWDLSPVEYKIWVVMQHRVYPRQIHSVGKFGGLSVPGAVLNSHILTRLLTSDEKDIKCVSMLNLQSLCCPYLLHSMWLVWLLHLYEIMPATLANTLLFILQGSALADLRYGGRF